MASVSDHVTRQGLFYYRLEILIMDQPEEISARGDWFHPGLHYVLWY